MILALRHISIGKLTIKPKPTVKYLNTRLKDEILREKQNSSGEGWNCSLVIKSANGEYRNIWGFISSKKRLLGETTQSVLLYPAVTWANAKASRWIVSTYHIVSDEGDRGSDPC